MIVAAQELHLGGPGGLVDLDGEHPLVEAHRADMIGHVRADRVDPPAEHTTDLDPVGAAQRLHDRVDRS